MACIAIVVEHEEGHLNPTFRLARRLQARGHKVTYLGPADGAGFVRAQGLSFEPVLEKIFPPGSMRTQRAVAEAAEGGDRGAEIGRSQDDTYSLHLRILCDLAEGEGFDRVVHLLRPDLFLFTSFFAAQALVARYRYGVPVSLLTPLLRVHPKSDFAVQAGRLLDDAGPAGERVLEMARQVDPSVQQMGDLAERLLAIRELILCPADLELPEIRHDGEPEVHYVEASVDLERKSERPFPWERLDPERKLLYVSLGSQTYRFGRANLVAFLRMVGEAFAARRDWQVVLATGGLVDPEEVPAPPGTVVVGWAPQLDLLRRARVAITHGGLGTIKECISLGVPMVIFPFATDGPVNAFRVARHQLGVQSDFKAASPAHLLDLVMKADEAGIRASVERMQRRFCEVDESGESVRLIEELLQEGTS